MFRFTLLTLFGAILVISVGCAALVSASDTWAWVVVTATVLVLLVATVGALYLPDRGRAFAGGFAVFGWVYLLLAQGPWFESLKPQLATTVALNKLQGVMHGESNASMTIATNLTGLPPSGYIGGSQPGGTQAIWVTSGVALSTPGSTNFHQIGQSLWAILLASIGGVLARAFGDRRLRPGAV